MYVEGRVPCAPSEGKGTRVGLCFKKPSGIVNMHGNDTVRTIIVSKILCYLRGVSTSTVKQVHEGVISLFNMQELHDAFHLYH